MSKKTDVQFLKDLREDIESQYPGLIDQIKSITDQNISIFISRGAIEQKSDSGNVTIPLE
jgi:hypothetical protein